jgi:hypothetical protein
MPITAKRAKAPALIPGGGVKRWVPPFTVVYLLLD